MTGNDADLLSVPDAATALHLTRDAVDDAITRQHLPVAKTLPGWRTRPRRLIARAAVEAYRRERLGQSGWAPEETDEEIVGLTTAQVAERLKLSRQRVGQLIAEKRLDARRRRHQMIVSEESVARYELERQPPGRPPRVSRRKKDAQ